MEIELEPDQPEELVRVIAELVSEEGAAVDPWWQAGIDEALQT